MTLMDERETRAAARSSAADTPQSVDADGRAVTPGGAYTADVLRVVRGTPNPQELAALVAALLLTRRSLERRGADGQDGPAAGPGEPRLPGRPRSRYTAPGAWAAGR